MSCSCGCKERRPSFCCRGRQRPNQQSVTTFDFKRMHSWRIRIWHRNLTCQERIILVYSLICCRCVRWKLTNSHQIHSQDFGASVPAIVNIFVRFPAPWPKFWKIFIASRPSPSLPKTLETMSAVHSCIEHMRCNQIFYIVLQKIAGTWASFILPHSCLSLVPFLCALCAMVQGANKARRKRRLEEGTTVVQASSEPDGLEQAGRSKRTARE